MNEKLLLAVDIKEKKVGCVLLQAAYGTDYHSINFAALFPPQTWLLAPTPDLIVYSIAREDIEKFSRYLKERYQIV